MSIWWSCQMVGHAARLKLPLPSRLPPQLPDWMARKRAYAASSAGGHRVLALTQAASAQRGSISRARRNCSSARSPSPCKPGSCKGGQGGSTSQRGCGCVRLCHGKHAASHPAAARSQLVGSTPAPAHLRPIHGSQAGMGLCVARHLAHHALHHAPRSRGIAGLEQQRGMPQPVACGVSRGASRRPV